MSPCSFGFPRPNLPSIPNTFRFLAVEDSGHRGSQTAHKHGQSDEPAWFLRILRCVRWRRVREHGACDQSNNGSKPVLRWFLLDIDDRSPISETGKGNPTVGNSSQN